MILENHITNSYSKSIMLRTPRPIPNMLAIPSHLIIYEEWCGENVQKSKQSMILLQEMEQKSESNHLQQLIAAFKVLRRK